MPELPEVETIKNYLEPQIINKKIIKVEVLRKGQIIGDHISFSSKLENETFLRLSRYGKYLFFHLTNELVIISHLRMEGKFFLFDENEQNTKHARVVFHLDTDEKLIFDDSRAFGMMKLSNELTYMKEKEISKLGPEPFDVNDINALLCKVKPKSNIKATLLDQTFLAGIGNIYADEILYDCNIHPSTLAKEITKEKWKQIINSAVNILSESIKQNGSTIKSYHPSKDTSGSFQNQLHVYGKKDQRCPKCNSIFKKTTIAARGTTYCPLCQRKESIYIALTGPSGCGKSTVSSYLKSKGYKTFNCDIIVQKLYENPSFAQYLGEKLDIPFNNHVDKTLLKEYINKHPNNKKILESFVHPKVKQELTNILSKNKGIVIVEVPLLFETGLNELFDIIIAVNSSKQDELLLSREGSNAELIKKINSTNKFNTYKEKVDLLINNDGTLQDLYNQVDTFFSKL